MSTRILCFGSINIDDVFQVDHITSSGETQSSSGYKRLAGGKGANQSVGAAQAKSECIHFGKIGIDGEWVKRLMSSKNVDTRHIILDEVEASGRAIIQVSQSTGDNAIILFAGTNKQISHSDIDAFFSRNIVKRGDWLMAQNEVNNGGVVLKRCYDMGMVVVFNPAPMTSNLLEEYSLSHVHILIVNETEASGLYKILTDHSSENQVNTSNDIVLSMNRIADSLVSQVPETVAGIVITLGEHGLIARFRDAGNNEWYDIRMAAIPTNVVDTTGAGDTFVGYFTAILSSHFDFDSQSHSSSIRFNRDLVELALTRASAASSIACKSEGAMSSIPSLDQVLEEEESLKKLR